MHPHPYVVAVQGAVVGALLLGQLHPDHHHLHFQPFGQVLLIRLHAPWQRGGGFSSFRQTWSRVEAHSNRQPWACVAAWRHKADQAQLGLGSCIGHIAVSL